MQVLLWILSRHAKEMKFLLRLTDSNTTNLLLRRSVLTVSHLKLGFAHEALNMISEKAS